MSRNAVMRSVCDYLLGLGQVVDVVLNPRVAGCVVPDHAARAMGGYLVLNIGSNLPRPIQGFVVDEKGFSGRFSFGGILGRVVVPWSAIERICTGRLSYGIALPPCELPETLARERATAPRKAKPGRPTNSSERAKALGIRRIK